MATDAQEAVVQFSPSEETETAWRWLEQHGRWAEGFWLVFVFTDSPPQAHILQERLGEFLRARGQTQRIVRPESTAELETAVGELGRAGDDREACVWVECVRRNPLWSSEEREPWAKAWEQTLLRGNEQRERLRSRGRGIVLVMRTDLKSTVSRVAPDLWSIRDGLLTLASSRPLAVPLHSPRIMEAMSSMSTATDALLDAFGWKVGAKRIIENWHSSREAIATIETAAEALPESQASLFAALATFSLAIHLSLDARHGEAIELLQDLELTPQSIEHGLIQVHANNQLALVLAICGRFDAAERAGLAAFAVSVQSAPVLDPTIVATQRMIYRALGRPYELELLNQATA